MATSSKRDVKLSLQVETLGADSIKQLANDVRSLGKEGGAAAPEFDRLANELDRIASQTKAAESFKALNTQLVETSAAQKSVSERALELKGAFDQATQKVTELAAAQTKAKTAVVESKQEINSLGTQIAVLKAETDSAGKSTQRYRDSLAELVDQQGKARNANVQRKAELTEINAALRDAEKQQGAVNTQLGRADSAVTKLSGSLAEQTRTITAAVAAGEKLGVNLGQVASEEARLLGEAQGVTTALKQIQVQQDAAAASALKTAVAFSELSEALLAEGRFAAEVAALQNGGSAQKAANDTRALAEAQLELNAQLQREAQLLRQTGDTQLASELETIAAATARRAQTLQELNEQLSRQAQAQTDAATSVRAAAVSQTEADNLLTIQENALAEARERGALALQGEQAALADATAVSASFTAQQAEQIEADRLAVIQENALAEARERGAIALRGEQAALVDAAAVSSSFARQQLAAAESTRAMVSAAQAAERVIEEAFARTGVRSFNAIEVEIAQTEAAMSTLQRKFEAGAISANDLTRALGGAAVRLQALKAEMLSVPTTPGVFEQMSSTISGLIGKFGALAAAIATIGIVVKPAIDAELQLQRVDRVLTQVLGSSQAAANQIARLRDVANQSGQSFGAVADSYTRFATSAISSGIPLQTVNKVFEATANAAGNLGLSADKVTHILDALGQMASKGVVSMEELRQQLGDSLPGALSLLAKGLGITEPQLNKLVTNGQLLSRDALPALGDALIALGAKNGAAVGGMQAEWNRLKNTITETTTLVTDGAFGKAFGFVLGGLSTGLKNIAFLVASLGEVFNVLGAQIGTVISAIVNRDFKNLRNELRQIEQDSIDKLGKLADRMDGVATATQGAAKQAATGATAFEKLGNASTSVVTAVTQGTAAMSANAAAHGTAAQAANQNATAQAGSAVATLLAAAQAKNAAVSWVALSVAFNDDIAKATLAAEANKKLAEASKTAGDTAKTLAELTGNEVTIKNAALTATENYSKALGREAAADQALVDTLKAKLAAMEAENVARGGTDAGLQEQIKQTKDLITAKDAEAERSKQTAALATQEIATRKLAIESLRDNSGRLEEYEQRVSAAKAALDQISTSHEKGVKTSESLAKATQDLAYAEGLLNDAIKDTEKVSEDRIKVLQADLSITTARLKNEQAAYASSEALAKAQGNEAQAIYSKVRQKEKEIEIVNAATKAKIAEADETIRTTNLILIELKSTGQLTPEKERELQLRIKMAQAKKVESEAGRIQAAQLQQEIDLLQLEQNLYPAIIGSIKDKTKALEDANAAQERANAAVEKAAELERKRLNVDKQGFTLGSDGERFTATAGAVDENGEREFIYTASGPIKNPRYHDGSQPLIKATVDPRVAAALVGTNYVPPAPAPAPAPTPTPAPVSSGQTVKVDLNGTTTTIKVVSSSDATALQTLLSQLASASGSSSSATWP